MPLVGGGTLEGKVLSAPERAGTTEEGLLQVTAKPQKMAEPVRKLLLRTLEDGQTYLRTAVSRCIGPKPFGA